MRTHKTLILGRNSVARLTDAAQTIRVVEAAFRDYSLGRAQMPSKIYLDLPSYHGDFRAMPAYVDSLKSASIKWVNVHRDNPSKGLPTVMAVIILSDPATGFPLCVMDGTLVTSLRTAAAGAVAAKYLAKKDSRIVALVGCGAQARTQLAALRVLFDVSEVRVWGHKPSLVRGYVQAMKRAREKMIPCGKIESCVRGADIIVTTTPSDKPLVKRQWVSRGAHINAIGADAPGKQELDHKILKHAKVVIDDWAQASHSGEINVPVHRRQFSKKDVYASLGDVVAKKKKGRRSQGEITVFDSTGLAIQDTAVATLIYRNALRKNKGLWVSLV